MSLTFELLCQAGAARRGRLRTPHGAVETPAFMPVASQGAVKGMLPQEVAEAGASILLANLYHLHLRPGVPVIEGLGGIHRFVGWPGPILTDSGGYQVFSLAPLRQVGEDGVVFRSHLDGSLVSLTPEGAVDLQRRLGVDVAMMLDECPAWPVDRDAAEAAMERTLGWARRARQVWPGGPGGLFGIVQGSVFRDLRERAVEATLELEFDGYAVGGVAVGESLAQRRSVVEWTAPLLPAGQVRYLMGVGLPQDILHAVAHGVDLFDCVLPTRNGRHGVLFTRQGLLRIKNARFREDPGPPDPACSCPVCRRLGRSLLHHLARAGDLTAGVLATVHNLRYYLDLMAEVRRAIESGRLAELTAEVTAAYPEPAPSAAEAPG